MKLFSSVLALALLATTAANALGVTAKPVDIGRSAKYSDVKGGKEVEKIDFLRAQEFKNIAGRVDSLKSEILKDAGLKDIVSSDVFKLGQNGKVTDATDVVTLQALKGNLSAQKVLSEMIIAGENPALVRVMARYMAVRKGGKITPESIRKNNKSYVEADAKEGKTLRAQNHLELISNMSLELYKNPSLSETQALELAIMRLKVKRGEHPSREEVAALAEKLLRENCG